MQFLRTIFWVILAVLAAVFSFANWTTVALNFGSYVVETKLPVILLIAFLIGLAPALIVHRATRWSLRRKLDAAHRTLEETRAAAVEPATTVAAQPSTTP